MSDAVRDSIEIAAPLDDVFAVAVDIDSYPQWNESIEEVEVRKRDEAGRPLEVWMKVDARLKVLQYTLGYDYSKAPESFSWSLIEGDVAELAGSYSFEELDDVTEVKYELKVDPGFPVPRFLRRQAVRMIARGALEDLKERAESLR